MKPRRFCLHSLSTSNGSTAILAASFLHSRPRFVSTVQYRVKGTAPDTWPAFELHGQVHTFSHLDPRSRVISIGATAKQPARDITIETTFGHHCFSRGLADGETIDPAELMAIGRETRVFCPRRYALSIDLPALTDSLETRPCYHSGAGRGNYFIVKVGTGSAPPVDYCVYFRCRPIAQAVRVHVESAYERADRPHRRAPKIGFALLAAKTLAGEDVRRP